MDGGNLNENAFLKDYKTKHLDLVEEDSEAIRVIGKDDQIKQDGATPPEVASTYEVKVWGFCQISVENQYIDFNTFKSNWEAEIKKRFSTWQSHENDQITYQYYDESVTEGKNKTINDDNLQEVLEAGEAEQTFGHIPTIILAKEKVKTDDGEVTEEEEDDETGDDTDTDDTNPTGGMSKGKVAVIMVIGLGCVLVIYKAITGHKKGDDDIKETHSAKKTFKKKKKK